MAYMTRDLLLLIHQFLKEEGNFKSTIHYLEKESGLFFDMRYFEEIVLNGDLDEVDRYMSAFTRMDDNKYSFKIFFEIKKHKYLEALDRHDYPKVVELVRKELKAFSSLHENLYRELTMLITLDNFRENEQLSKYGDTKTTRNLMLVELKKLIESNPLLSNKLQFPSFENSRLRTLIIQSLNWQHHLCKQPKIHLPEVNTLFVDHHCCIPHGGSAPSPAANHPIDPVPNVGRVPPLDVCDPSQNVSDGACNHPLGSVPNVGRVPPLGVCGPSQNVSDGACNHPLGSVPNVGRVPPLGVCGPSQNVSDGACNHPLGPVPNVGRVPPLGVCDVFALCFYMVQPFQNVRDGAHNHPIGPVPNVGRVPLLGVCGPSQNVSDGACNHPLGPVPNVGRVPPLGVCNPFQNVSDGACNHPLGPVPNVGRVPPLGVCNPFQNVSDGACNHPLGPVPNVGRVPPLGVCSPFQNVRDSACNHPIGPVPNVGRVPPLGVCNPSQNVSNGACNHPLGPVPNVGRVPPLGVCGPSQPAPAQITGASAGWLANPNSLHPQTVSGPFGLIAASNIASTIKCPRELAANNVAVEYQLANSDTALKRPRPCGISDGGSNIPMDVLPSPIQSQVHILNSPDDLPKKLVTNLTQGSTVRSMDFHPVQHSLLLVGTNIGDLTIWEVVSKDRLVFRNFNVWDIGSCSETLQSSLATEYSASINRILWSPDGKHVAVAYSKHLVHIYSFHGGSDLQNLLEIDAHSGNVNDAAFTQLNHNLCIVTCGEDKKIKVWDVVKGCELHTFEGHEAPVYSVCPHIKYDIQFIFSTATDGKIKAWLYDDAGSRINYEALGRSCITMSYTMDGSRLFSCGTNKEGESFLVEWNDDEGSIKRTYHGLSERSVGIVQFDTAKNKYLAVGDEFLIKFWDMENPNLLTTSDAEGSLPASPCVRFNREGTLLAISTSDNGIKVLANSDGVQFIRTTERHVKACRGTSESKNAGCQSLPDAKLRLVDQERCKDCKPLEIIEPSQLHCLRLPDHTLSATIMRLMYTSAGNAVFALTGNAVHKLWKWRNEQNVAVEASASTVPVLWQPSSGMLMTNEIVEANPEEAVPCFAISKNDSYVMSTSGGKVSLFNLITFKTMTACIKPPPAATSLAFQPEDNNVIAVGLDDSTIQIYNVRVDEVLANLEGHQKKVTGLAFSKISKILVSSCADAQMCVWSTDNWEMQASKSLQIPKERLSNPKAQTRLQFHTDQIHLLVIHESQIAVCEVPKLDVLKQWFPLGESSEITDATYSCDGQSICVSLFDGTLAILTSATLTLRCLISSSAYIPPNPSTRVIPLAVASHPSSPNQFAVGLSDGAVHILEPLDQEGKWGTNPP